MEEPLLRNHLFTFFVIEQVIPKVTLGSTARVVKMMGLSTPAMKERIARGSPLIADCSYSAGE
jgi:hypothetical protein